MPVMQTGMHPGRGVESISKQPQYLLITWSFPHSPQVSPQGWITVEMCWGYTQGIYIIGKRLCLQIAHFFGCRNFYHGEIFVQKFLLDKEVYIPPCWHPERSASGVEGSWHFVKYERKIGAKIPRLALLAGDDILLRCAGNVKRAICRFFFGCGKKFILGVDFMGEGRYNV